MDARFNSQMLTLARHSREMTQTELARKVEVSQATISKIENGLMEPDKELVAKLVKVLEYPAHFFGQPGYARGLPLTFYRTRKRLPRRVEDRINAEISIRTLHVERLVKAAELESDRELPAIDLDEAQATAAEIATMVRQAWGLARGPVPNLVETVEAAGVVVVPCDLGSADVDAIGVRYPGLPPMMFVNVDAPTDRMRFTIAHELGHLVMHTVPNPDMEKEANMFAAEFLMPERDIKPQFRNVELSLLAMLKQVWRVSIQALIHRAWQVGAISKRKYQALFRQISALGFRRREPPELDLPPEEPSLLRQLVVLHRDALQYGMEQLAHLLGLFPHQYRRLYEPEPVRSLRLVAG